MLVHNRYQQPGGEDVVFRQERELLERAGHSVVTYHRSNWELDDSYIGIKQLALAGRTIWSHDTRAEFSEILRTAKPELIHIHNTFVVISPSIYAACQDAGIPVVQTLHNYRLFCPAATFFRNGKVCEECVEHTLWRSVQHACYRDSRSATAAVALMLEVHRRRKTWTRDVNCYIALTEFARQKCVQGGLPPEKICVKPNFAYPDPGLHKCEGEYVMFAGRLAPKERIEILLKAWSLLKNRIPLVIIGDGAPRKELEAEAARRGLTGITFRGFLTHDETLEAMKRARMLVFSSSWYETFPLTIAEAFACGIPVVCSRIGAMQEMVEDNRTGLNFISGNAEDLAAKVDWAWNNKEQVRAMGHEARREYESKYTAEKNYLILMDIYRRAIGKTA